MFNVLCCIARELDYIYSLTLRIIDLSQDGFTDYYLQQDEIETEGFILNGFDTSDLKINIKLKFRSHSIVHFTKDCSIVSMHYG